MNYRSKKTGRKMVQTEMTKRRYTKIEERLIDCACCKYPISQRHHLLPISVYGENECTIQLCTRCHELYHILYNAHDKYQNTLSMKVFKSLSVYLGLIKKMGYKKDHSIEFLQNLVNRVYQIRKEKGE
jgi:hypothetical protein